MSCKDGESGGGGKDGGGGGGSGGEDDYEETELDTQAWIPTPPHGPLPSSPLSIASHSPPFPPRPRGMLAAHRRARQQIRQVYNGPGTLRDLAVGAGQVAAYDAAAGRILWWRGGGQFLQTVGGPFRSVVSGDGFTCAVEANATAAVRCWGPDGSAVQVAFANASGIPYLAAGGSRACGVLASGAVLCSGTDSASGSANATADLFFPFQDGK